MIPALDQRRRGIGTVWNKTEGLQLFNGQALKQLVFGVTHANTNPRALRAQTGRTEGTLQEGAYLDEVLPMCELTNPHRGHSLDGSQ